MKNLTPYYLALVFSFYFSLNAQLDLSSLKDKNILIVYGGWKGHQPEIFANKIAAWLKDKDAKVTLSESTKIFTNEDLMRQVDLIIQHITMSKMSGSESRALQEAVKRGVGLAGCHGGLGDAFRNNTEYQYMIGGQFVKHPGGQVDYTVNITAPENPLVMDIKDFALHSEQYYMHIDPAITILATTQFTGENDAWIEGIEIPVVWTKPYGKGRIFYSSLGHNEEDFDIPQVWEIITRGITWAASPEIN
ncbi:MAG: ThuA domain-containing protein [Flavobacteriaceae bacterium]|nr:ThuA domain-containing protein [Flavobacteriaceae bacterium]MDG2503882.1 ThuA domain-containing protein [Flavobacteriaceae bacterium]